MLRNTLTACVRRSSSASARTAAAPRIAVQQLVRPTLPSTTPHPLTSSSGLHSSARLFCQNKTSDSDRESTPTETGHSEQPMASSGPVEAPYTGWDHEIPSRTGGSEEGYLFKPPYYWQSKEFETKYKASCWCGRIKFEYHGDPIDAKHCHCTQCQRLHGAPFQWAALYHKTSVRLAHDCDPSFLSFFSTHTKYSEHLVPCKIACAQCHSPLMDEGRNMVMAYPSSFQFKDGHVPPAFAPSAHIFYGESIVEVDDGVPKWSGHKDHSEILPHVLERHGKLGHGQSGKVKRGEHGEEANGASSDARPNKKNKDDE
ncbi:unnamed protein product [Jaminaea pallidilutea]